MFASVPFDESMVACPLCGGRLIITEAPNDFTPIDFAITFYSCSCDVCGESMFVRTKMGETKGEELHVYRDFEVHVQSLTEYYGFTHLNGRTTPLEICPTIPVDWERTLWINTQREKERRRRDKRSKTSSKNKGS